MFDDLEAKMDALNFIFQLAAAGVVIALAGKIAGKAGVQITRAIIRKALPLIRSEIRRAELQGNPLFISIAPGNIRTTANDAGLPALVGSNDDWRS